MAATVTITKLQNDKVEIIDSDKDVCKSLDPRLDVYKRGGRLVIQYRNFQADVWGADEVLEVIRKDGTVVPILSDLDLLYSELSTFFFFDNVGSGGTGTGWAGVVANKAALPAATSSGDVYLVQNSTGILWGSRKGLYEDTGTWNRLSNATFQVLDSQSKIIDDVSGFGLTDQLSSLTADRVRTWQDKSGIVAYLSDLSPSFNVDLDSGEATVTRVFTGGRTTFTVTHSLNTLDIKPEVFRLSDGRTVGWRVERTGVNTAEVSRNGNIADGLFRIVI